MLVVVLAVFGASFFTGVFPEGSLMDVHKVKILLGTFILLAITSSYLEGYADESNDSENDTPFEEKLSHAKQVLKNAIQQDLADAHSQFNASSSALIKLMDVSSVNANNNKHIMLTGCCLGAMGSFELFAKNKLDRVSLEYELQNLLKLL